MGVGMDWVMHEKGHWQLSAQGRAPQCSTWEMALAALGVVEGSRDSAWGGRWQCCHPAVLPEQAA